MSDDDALRRRYQGAMARQHSGGDDPTLEELEALATGRLDDRRALELLDQVMASPRLKAEFELLRATHGAGRRMSPRPAMPVWLAAAAAVTLVVAGGLTWRLREGSQPVMRGVGSVALAAPADNATVTPPVTLAWRPSAGAIGYAVTVMDSAGGAVMSASTTDTTVVVSDGLVSGSPYRWWLDVTASGGNTVRSAVGTFRVRAGDGGSR